MSDTYTNHPTQYQIVLAGTLDAQWASWFEQLTITATPTGETILTGPVTDQAALYGLLKKARDLGMPLLSVCCLPNGNSK